MGHFDKTTKTLGEFPELLTILFAFFKTSSLFLPRTFEAFRGMLIASNIFSQSHRFITETWSRYTHATNLDGAYDFCQNYQLL